MRRSKHRAPVRITRLLEALRSESPVRGLTHTHYRYPARFSPAFARRVIASFTRPGDFVLDPFMGGGTTVVEALAAGRRCVGGDINPLATFVARVKTTPLSGRDLDSVANWQAHFAGGTNARISEDIADEWRDYQRHIPWWLRKTLAFGLESHRTLEQVEQRRFARATLMRTAQWALDCRETIPTIDQFLMRHESDTLSMLHGAEAYAARVRKRLGNIRSMTQHRRLLIRDAAELVQAPRYPRNWGPPRLVLTSPPYPGVHILYHRWQVRGRRETPAPYWLAGHQDGNGGSFYTFGDRRRQDVSTYLNSLTTCFKQLGNALDSRSLVVQLVAFPRPELQLRNYLKAMTAAGYEKAEVHGLPDTVFRRVPNRKWYADSRGPIPASKEFLLVHKKA